MNTPELKKAMASCIRTLKKPMFVRIRNAQGESDKAVYDPEDDKVYYEPYCAEIEAMSLENTSFLVLGGLLDNAIHGDDEELGESAADALEHLKDRFR